MGGNPDVLNPFQTRQPNIDCNEKLREPQRFAHAALVSFTAEGAGEREVGIVLPVGCGKSGCIALAPFAFRARRALVVAPGVKIAGQLFSSYFDPRHSLYFYKKYGVLDGQPYPEPVENPSVNGQPRRPRRGRCRHHEHPTASGRSEQVVDHAPGQLLRPHPVR